MMIRLAAIGAAFYVIFALFIYQPVGATPCGSKAPEYAGLVPFESEDMWGYRDGAGTIVIAPNFLFAGEFSSKGIAPVYLQSQGWAYIDTRGDVLIAPMAFDNGPDPFADGLARFIDNRKYGYFDENACVAVTARFDGAMPFSEGLAAVCEECILVGEEHKSFEGGRWGYIDATGRVVIPMRFDRASRFDNGKAQVLVDREPQVIDRAGNLVTP